MKLKTKLKSKLQDNDDFESEIIFFFFLSQ